MTKQTINANEAVRAIVPGITKWPAKAGPAPTINEFKLALALLQGSERAVKAITAVAAYFRSCANEYSVEQVAYAVGQVCGGLADDKRNVVNIRLAGQYGYVTVTKNKATNDPRHTAYKLELTVKGKQVVEKYNKAADKPVEAQADEPKVEKPVKAIKAINEPAKAKKAKAKPTPTVNVPEMALSSPAGEPTEVPSYPTSAETENAPAAV